ncbi:hypothetical protein ACFLZI_00140 [Nitrospirota bacterium]
MQPAHLKVEHPCPQCGAPVIMEEADHFFECGFCRVRLCIGTSDFHRYYIAPKTRSIDDVLFVPYWHLRGTRLMVEPYKVTQKMMDTSLLAREIDYMPPNLGYRTQTLKLHFASPKLNALFLQPTFPYEDVVKQTEYLNRTAMSYQSEVKEPFHKAFIGEAVSMIFAPIYIKGSGIFDAVLDRPLTRKNPRREEALEGAGRLRPWRLRFIPAHCPTCGWDMEGANDSVVFTCRNCDSAWSSNSNGFKKVPFRVVHTRQPDALHIPFWRIDANVEGIAASSYADIVRLANLPKVIRATWEKEKMYFWFPAVKLNPRGFTRLSMISTLHRPGFLFKDKARGEFRRTTLAPTNVEATEAAEGLHALLASMAVDKKMFFPLLADVKVKSTGKQLYYFPFVRKGTDYVQPDMGFSIQKNAFRG